MAFTDGRASDEYRKERFAAVLHEFNLETADVFLDKLVATYKNALEISLEPKPGAVSLLKYLKRIGKKIMIISERPQDAQDWTVEKLGFGVSHVQTTNMFGVSKIDGLFEKVQEKFCFRAKDMVYVGDSEEGMLAVHYDEKATICLDLEGMKINTLSKLEHILRSGDTS